MRKGLGCWFGLGAAVADSWSCGLWGGCVHPGWALSAVTAKNQDGSCKDEQILPSQSCQRVPGYLNPNGLDIEIQMFWIFKSNVLDIEIQTGLDIYIQNILDIEIQTASIHVVWKRTNKIYLYICLRSLLSHSTLDWWSLCFSFRRVTGRSCQLNYENVLFSSKF